MADEAATAEHGGPQGPVDASWLILQRLSDLKEPMGDLRRGQDALTTKIEALDARIDAKIEALDAKIGAKIEALDAKIDAKIGALDAKIESKTGGLDARIESLRKELDAKIESVRTWSIGLLLLAIVGLLVKLFLPVG